MGTAYVESPLVGAPRLNFMLVADQWRSRGIASRLLAAGVEKWPTLEFSGPISENGQKWVERAVRDQESFVPGDWQARRV